MLLKTSLRVSSISTISTILIRIIKMYFPVETSHCNLMQVCSLSVRLFCKQRQL